MALTDQLVAYYKFNNGALTTDSVGSYTLTNTNSIANSSDGKIDYCADAGTSNTTKYLSRDDTYGMLGSTAKTYSFWWKCTVAPGVGTTQAVFRHLYGGSAVGNYANVFYHNNAGTYEVIMPTSPAGMAVTKTLTVGTWYHFAVTIPANNTGNITCYVNGVAIGTTPNWAQNYGLTTRLVIFADHAFGDISPGETDEFGIWARVLTENEILNLYKGGFGNAYPFSSTENTFKVRKEVRPALFKPGNSK